MTATKSQTAISELGEKVATAEDAAIGMATNRLYRFRMQHPGVFTLIAFAAGALVGLAFVLASYGRWSYEGVDLLAFMVQAIVGVLGGGIVAVIAAFAYTRTLRPTLEAMQANGLGGSPVRRTPSGQNRVTSVSS